LKRGEIWSVAGGPDYAGKPRPAIILQSDQFDLTPSITVCLLTSTHVHNVHARFTIVPSERNGLEAHSDVMIDKISTIPRVNVGRRIGQLDSADLTLLNQRVVLFLGLAE
jgi:mRNA interferase MazF